MKKKLQTYLYIMNIDQLAIKNSLFLEINCLKNTRIYVLYMQQIFKRKVLKHESKK